MYNQRESNNMNHHHSSSSTPYTMRTWLRAIVAAPKRAHYDPQLDLNLDLAYITPRLIVTSGPVDDWFHAWYRHHVTELVLFLDHRHHDMWHMWNFRAEGPGYTDEAVRGKVSHYPFPDHQVPTLEVLKECTDEIDKWLKMSSETVAVLHCKAGKGRSGTMCCAYMLKSQLKELDPETAVDDVMEEYSTKRMKSSAGKGISIKSQIRYLRYWYLYLLASDSAIIDSKDTAADAPYTITLIRFKGLSRNAKIDIETYLYSEGRYTVQSQGTYSIEKSSQLVSPNLQLQTPDVRILVDEYAYCWFNVNFESTAKTALFLWTQFDGFKGTSFKGIEVFEEITIEWN